MLPSTPRLRAPPTPPLPRRAPWRTRVLAVVACVAVLALPRPSDACGPHFASPHLAWLGAAMLDSPKSHFEADMRALTRTLALPREVRAVRKTTAAGDAEDLRAALGPGPATEATVQAYLAARQDTTRALPAGLPEEFARYAEAVRRLQAKDFEGALRGFEALLALPVDQRRHRTTWAAYMVARLLEVQGAPASERAAAYRAVQGLARQDVTDTTGLVAASLYHASWQHLQAEEWAASVEACLLYRASGGQRGCAGFDHMARGVLEGGPDTMRAVMQASPLTAEVVAAWLTSGPHGGWAPVEGVATGDLHAWHVQRWLDVAGSLDGPVGGADRLGWAAYSAGAFDDAARWVARADPDAPVAHWIAGKLALRDGDLDGAIEALERAATLMPAPDGVLHGDAPWGTGCTHDTVNPVRALLEELGVALVSAGRFEDALQVFLKAGDWVDAAWVAERLLTTDELQRYVGLLPPLSPYAPSAPSGSAFGANPELSEREGMVALSDLLARRLVREGRYLDAHRYFVGQGRRSAVLRLARLLREGADTARTDAERGAALWAAAQQIKADGWDLFATELEPDFRVLSGSFEAVSTSSRRLAGLQDPSSMDPDELATVRLLAPTAGERERIAAHAPPIDRRYHFVYTATEVAWQAVQLLPQGHPELVEALCVAGGWTRVRDPEGADRFFQLLGRKGRDSPEGRALLARGWWPPLALDGTCAVPEPEPVASGGCATSPEPPGRTWAWWVVAGLLGLATRRRAAPAPGRPLDTPLHLDAR